jgi:hypothetical protein
MRRRVPTLALPNTGIWTARLVLPLPNHFVLDYSFILHSLEQLPEATQAAIMSKMWEVDPETRSKVRMLCPGDMEGGGWGGQGDGRQRAMKKELC